MKTNCKQLTWSTGGWGYNSQDYDEFGIATCVYVIQPSSSSVGVMMIQLSFLLFDFDFNDVVNVYEVSCVVKLILPCLENSIVAFAVGLLSQFPNIVCIIQPVNIY